MSRVRLRLVLADPDRPRAAGEVLEGRVDLEADEPCEMKSLAVSVGWRTTGSANEASGPRVRQTLASARFEGGERASYPFRVGVPPGPPTYAGKRFGVLWIARADAALSWATDPKAEAPFVVVPAAPGGGSLLEKSAAGGVELGCAVVSSLVLLVSALGLLASRGGSGAGWFLAALLGGAGLLFMLPRALSLRRLGRVTFEAGPSPLARGDEVACRITARPRRDVAVKRVIAVLTAAEKYEIGSGKSRTTRLVEVARRPVVLEGPSSAPAGAEAVWAGVIPVPGDGPPTLLAGPHSVTWRVRGIVEVPVLPDGKWDLAITVT